MGSIPFILEIPLHLPFGGFYGHDIIEMILHAGPMVKFVLLILLGFSVACWTIILMKFRLVRRARHETETFQDMFLEPTDLRRIYASSKDLRYSPVARLFRSGYGEFQRIRKIQAGGEKSQESSARSRQIIMDNLQRSLEKAVVAQTDRLERGVSFLATTGNTAPFIGLFGTVWGIMQAFRGIGLKGSANLAVVAPGISEALIATAAGLAAAIPAVVAFNYFTQKIAVLGAEMDIFKSDFLTTVERQLFRGEGRSGTGRE
ncbi:MAG: protein TolQ [Deltaproteobacteria bacterium]|nr:MAG: protein TolQ [Deltaproteobacteria bacterium]